MADEVADSFHDGACQCRSWVGGPLSLSGPRLLSPAPQVWKPGLRDVRRFPKGAQLEMGMTIVSGVQVQLICFHTFIYLNLL